MLSAVHDQYHAVQFFGRDEHLVATVAKFFAEGFIEGQPAVLVATPDHVAGILSALQQRMIDVAHARRTGKLVVLDAEETLDTLMDGPLPTSRRFERNVSGLLQKLYERGNGAGVRAYGEMVDLLWKHGLPHASIELERMWNKVVGRYGVSLLCGYSVANSYRDSALFEEVCRQHNHVLPGDPQFS